MTRAFGSRDEANDSPLGFLRFWRLDSSEVAREVARYGSLTVWQSSRGRSALLAALMLILGVVGAILTRDPAAAVFSIAIWGPVAFFLFRGAARAFPVAMVIFTLDRAMALLAGAWILLVVIWWAVGMGLFFRAYAVERARRATADHASAT